MNIKSRKPTKVAIVLEQLQDDILNGKFAPQEKLPIETLKQRYGLSGSPLREALSRLVANGLVQVEEQCGFCVAPLSLDELADIYNLRAHIENLALEMAILNGDDHWEAEILAAWHRFSKYIDPRINKNIEPAKWDLLQREFLYALVKACNSPWLWKIRDMLYDQAARYRVVCLNAHFNDEKVLRKLIKRDENLVAAVLARDTQAACRLSEEGYRDSANFIADVLRKSKASEANKRSKASPHKR
jgi:GntR family carbon starvation induced transcriptional regulator